MGKNKILVIWRILWPSSKDIEPNDDTEVPAEVHVHTIHIIHGQESVGLQPQKDSVRELLPTQQL